MIYRHYPLINIHDKAVIAAEASEAAAAQSPDLFWEFHSEIYARQEEFASQTQEDVIDWLVDLAADVGLDEEVFRADLENRTYSGYIEEMLVEAQNLQIPGTPTLIVNGRPLQGTPPYESWVSFIEETRQVAVLEELQYDAPPEMAIDESRSYIATVTMAGGDTFTIELFPESAPLTVNNFVFLAEEGWFDGVTFHRVLPGFVAQTGDPTGTGLGNPGYTIPNEVDPDLSHADTGIVAMANSGPDTNGSQWYITLGDASYLDGGYTIFGRVTEGMNIVQAISPRDPNTGGSLPPGDVIESIVIEESN